MLCGVRVDWPNDFVEKQKAIAKDPTRAQSELLFLHGKLHVIDAERHSLHRASKKAERRCLALERQRDEQRMRAQRSEHAQWVAEENFKGVEALRTVIEKKLNNLEHERDSEKVRADHLQRQLSKLQGEARQSHRSVRAALQKLTHSPAVAKRIAAACHPDKCPPELSEVASELFRFVQSNRGERGVTASLTFVECGATQRIRDGTVQVPSLPTWLGDAYGCQWHCGATQPSRE